MVRFFLFFIGAFMFCEHIAHASPSVDYIHQEVCSTKCRQPEQGPVGPTGPTGGIVPVAFGEIYSRDPLENPATQSGITGVPTTLTIFSANGLSTNTTPDHTLDRITVRSTGDYIVSFFISIEGPNNRSWVFAVAVNGVAQDNVTVVLSTEGSTRDNQAGAASGILSLTDGDVITVLVSQSGGAATLESTNSNLHLIRIQ